MKIYTDVEQSRKLAEIIPTNTSDGYLQAHWEEITTNHHFKSDYGEKIPAWSLNALINLFPAYKDDDMPTFNLTRGGWKPSFTRNWFASWGHWTFDAREPIDAVVGLILLLRENNIEFYNPLY